jgi:hypothetical protein
MRCTPRTPGAGAKALSPAAQGIPYQPRPTFHDAPPAEREHLREQIRHLKEWLEAVEADLEG